MSKFGMEIGGKTVYGIKTPDKALELIAGVVAQYFGELWTQHKPRCPLCDKGLHDTEKHMNRPVGECINPKCESTIHISDFIGKIKDVLAEWELTAEDWKTKVEDELRKKVRAQQHRTAAYGQGTSASAGGTSKLGDTEVIDEETVFVW
jgi:hypothetical protein